MVNIVVSLERKSTAKKPSGDAYRVVIYLFFPYLCARRANKIWHSSLSCRHRKSNRIESNGVKGARVRLYRVHFCLFTFTAIGNMRITFSGNYSISYRSREERRRWWAVRIDQWPDQCPFLRINETVRSNRRVISSCRKIYVYYDAFNTQMCGFISVKIIVHMLRILRLLLLLLLLFLSCAKIGSKPIPIYFILARFWRENMFSLPAFDVDLRGKPVQCSPAVAVSSFNSFSFVFGRRIR